MTPPLTPEALPDGFYACSEWPLWFTLRTHHGIQNIWGFSIWKNQPGYRTLGIPFHGPSGWLARHPKGVKIENDRDRTLDKEFLRDYRRIMKAAKEESQC